MPHEICHPTFACSNPSSSRVRLILCRPGDDFLAWKIRVVNIIVGATFAMAVSWLVLPFYASAEHLDLLAEAYCGAGDFIRARYDALYCNLQAAAQVHLLCCTKFRL